MPLSHRDHRIDGSIASAFWLMLALAAGLGATAILAPWPAVGLSAILGLGIVGGFFVLRSERMIAEYTGDLRSVRTGGDAGGWVRVEVQSEVGRDRVVGLPSRRSPHTRTAPVRGTAVPPVGGPRD